MLLTLTRSHILRLNFKGYRGVSRPNYILLGKNPSDYALKCPKNVLEVGIERCLRFKQDWFHWESFPSVARLRHTQSAVQYFSQLWCKIFFQRRLYILTIVLLPAGALLASLSTLQRIRSTKSGL